VLKSVDDISETKKRLRIEIPAELIETEIRKSLEKLRSSVAIPGFRAGRAPVSLIEKRFGKRAEAEVLEKVVPEHLSSAIREAALDPVTMPELDEEFEYKRNAPLSFSVTVEVKPKIEQISYDNLTAKDIPFEVKDAEVEEALKALQQKRAVFDVSDAGAETDDFVSFEFVDCVTAEGETVPSAKEAVSKMGNEVFPGDIMDKVLGKKKGDVVEFDRVFDETAPKELAGKQLRIRVRVSEVKRKTLPAIDDEFAKDLGYETVAELTGAVREKIRAAKADRVRTIQKAEIVRKLVDAHSFDVPESLVRREIESISLQRSLSGSPESSVPTGTATDGAATAQEPRAEGAEQEKAVDDDAAVRKSAVRNVQARFILDAIARKEGIIVSDAELNERIATLAQKMEASPEAIRNFYSYRDGSLEGLRQSMLEEKVMDLLLERATIEKENP